MLATQIISVEEDRGIKIGVVRNFSRKAMSAFGNEFHSFGHAEDVYSVAMKYAETEGLDLEERFFLGTAALLHDLVYVAGYSDNEELSANVSGAYLPSVGYSSGEISRVQDLIRVTEIPTNPGSDLAKRIICDADLDNLGRSDFFDRNDLLRIEFGLEPSLDWYAKSLKFLESHQYYTGSAKRLRDEGKRKNVEKLKDLIDSFPR